MQALSEIVLFDVVEAEGLVHDDPRLKTVAGDITDPAAVKALIGPGTGGVFHLAAIVSANAEEDFDLGYRVNLDGTRHVLEACRALPEPIKLVFASSVAVYGGEMPELLGDDYDPDAADLLRRPEGGGRAFAQRLQPQGLRRRPGAAAADHRRAPGPAQPGGLDLR